MAHTIFRRPPYCRTLRCSWMAIQATTSKHRGAKTDLIIQSIDPCVAKKGTRVALLPDDCRVLTPDGETEIQPTGEFYVSVETFDPYHLVLDISRSGVLR